MLMIIMKRCTSDELVVVCVEILLTSVICAERLLGPFLRHAPVEIDSDPLDNCCNRAQYKLVRLANKLLTMALH